MKAILIYIVVFSLLSCGRSKRSDIQNVQSEITASDAKSKNDSVSTFPIKMTDLQEKVFEIGSTTHFTDSCSFYFECDCCSGELIFDPDSTFYYKDYCVETISVAVGLYVIESNILYLKYSGRWVSKIYNLENETDTSAIDYIMTDTLVTPVTFRYSPTVCNNRVKLVGLENEEFAIDTDLDYREAVGLLNQDGFIDRLRNMKR